MTYFQRYRDGDHVAVWSELRSLGASVRDPLLVADATSVAQATMERVAKNVEIIVTGLGEQGYEFGVYPDGTYPAYRPAPIARPEARSLEHLHELERLAGTIPLSLREFWTTVGAISLGGRMKRDWPDYADPLIVYSPEAGLVELRDWPEDAGPFLCPFAPDVLHKDDVSGGAPYSVKLPDPGADAIVRDEWHEVAFVPYLRIAILEWCGFPGLSRVNPQERWRQRAPCEATAAWLKELSHELIAF